MHWINRLTIWFLPLTLSAIRATAEFRTWTSANGQQFFVAEYVGVEGSKLVLRDKSGKEWKTELKNINQKDIEYLRTVDPRFREKEDYTNTGSATVTTPSNAKSIVKEIDSTLTEIDSLIADHRLPADLMAPANDLRKLLNDMKSDIGLKRIGQSSEELKKLAKAVDMGRESLTMLKESSEQLATISTQNIEATKDDFNNYATYRTTRDTSIDVLGSKVDVNVRILTPESRPAFLMLSWNVLSDEWHFVDNIQFFGKETDFRLQKLDRDPYRRVWSYDTLSERCVASISSDELKELLKSQTIKCRVSGKHLVGDFVLTTQQRLAIEEMLLKYSELCNDTKEDSHGK